MTTSEAKTLRRVEDHGRLVARLSGPGGEAQVKRVDESRGASTGYVRRPFFYLVAGGRAMGMGDRSMRQVRAHWKSEGVTVRVVDEESWGLLNA